MDNDYEKPADGFTPYDLPKEVHMRRHRVQPPSSAYITEDDTLLWRIFSPTASFVVNLSLRYLTAQGEIVPEFHTRTVLSTGTTPLSVLIPGREGFLLSATVESINAPTGEVYTTLELQRGQGSGDATFGYMLFAGYPGPRFRIGFPQDVPRQPSEGRGWITTLTIANPAAGAEWSVTVPTGEQWIVRAVRARFVSSAAVATRFPNLVEDDGAGNLTVQSAPATGIAAAQTWDISWFHGAVNIQNNNVQCNPWTLDTRMPPGFLIRSITGNIQAADQWSAIALLVERFIAA